MKYLFLFVFLHLFFLTNGQVVLRPQVGVTVNSIENIGQLEFNNKLGYIVGADVLIGNRFYFQTGFFYEIVKNEIFTPLALSIDLEVDRIRVPAQLGVRFIEGKNEKLFNIRAFTGPVGSIVINSEVETNPNIQDLRFEDFVFGWNAGIGVDFLIAFIDFQYTWGLSDTFKNINIQSISGDDANRRIFYLSGGIKIRF